MKVCLIGNMNNNFFSLVRYLRDCNLDAELLLFKNEMPHFLPEADSFDRSFEKYVKKTNWSYNLSDVYFTPRREIIKTIQRYDYFIVCGTAPAYLAKVRVDPDLFIPFGSDIHKVAHYRHLFSAPFRKWHRFFYAIRMQRRGISKSRFVSLEKLNKKFENKFVRPLNIEDQRIFATCPFLYLPQYENGQMDSYLEKSTIYHRFLEIRKKFETVIIQHARQEWNERGERVVHPNVWSKGNDRFIRQFAKYVTDNSDRKICLILFEYGTSVHKSKNLIAQLSIQDRVFWMPKSFRRDIMGCLRGSDLVVGELFDSYLTYGSIIEGMAVGTPVLHKRIDALYTGEGLYPMLYGNTDEQIYHSIQIADRQKNVLGNIGLKSKAWVKEKFTEALGEYLSCLQ